MITALHGPEDGFGFASFSPDGTRIVTAGLDGTARVWDADCGGELDVLGKHAAPIMYTSFSLDGLRILTVSSDGFALVWDADIGTKLAVLQGLTKQPIPSASLNPDGTLVVTANWDGTARVMDATNNVELTVLKGHTDAVMSVAFSPDGARIVTASSDGTARVWHTDSGAERTVLQGHTNVVTSAVFNPDGTSIVTASEDNTARVWDTDSGTEIAVLQGHTQAVTSASFSPDGTHIVSAGEDSTARVWDAQSGSELSILEHDLNVISASFSPDGQRIITASWDTARVWDANSGEQLALWRHRDAVNSASFSPDGTRILTASSDGTAQVWDAGGYFQDITACAIPHYSDGEPTNIMHIHMSDTTKGWAIDRTDVDHIMHTSDGGNTWLDVTPPEPAPIGERAGKNAFSYFLDGSFAWVMYVAHGRDLPDVPETLIVWRTHNGGLHWEPSHPLKLNHLATANYYHTLHFTDDQHGWILMSRDGDAVLFRTTDGGANWIRVQDPWLDKTLRKCQTTGMAFADVQDGLITSDTRWCSDVPYIDWTHDGGLTWKSHPLPQPADDPDFFVHNICGTFGPNLFSPQSAILAMLCTESEDLLLHQSYLYTTTDGGQIWRIDPMPETGKFWSYNDLLLINPNVGFLLGRDIYSTHDGGRTWKHVRTVNWDGQFDFINEHHGWAVLMYGRNEIVHTIDGGRTWVLLNPQIVTSAPSMDVEERPAGVYAGDLSLNGTPRSITIGLGETIFATYFFQIWNGDGCPACDSQVVIGIGERAYDCIYNDNPSVFPGVTYIGTFTLQAPGMTGVYEILYKQTFVDSCDHATEAFEDDPPDSSQIIGILTVESISTPSP